MEWPWARKERYSLPADVYNANVLHRGRDTVDALEAGHNRILRELIGEAILGTLCMHNGSVYVLCRGQR